MKLKELRCVISANIVNLYTDYGKKDEFIREEYTKGNDYLSVYKNINMWDIYGEKIVEQIYANDSESINIDIENC